jgi:hypothetical protein
VTRRPGSEKSLAVFIGRELREGTRIQKSFCRRFAQMNADRIKPAAEKLSRELRE